MSQGFKRFNVYDAEFYDRRGGATTKASGHRTLKIDLSIFDTPEKVKEEMERMKEEQKKKNAEYRERVPIMRTIIDVKPLKTEGVKHSSKLNIKFDETGPSQATFALLASSKAGKTTLISTLFNKYYNKKKYITVLYSINSHIPLYSDFDIKISRIDKRTLNVIKVEHHINKNTDNKYSFLNVFDDMLNVRDKKILEECILTYRNANMSTIVSLQYPKLLSPSVRSNVNHLFFGKFNNDESKECVLKMWLQSKFRSYGYNTVAKMIEFYDELTRDHGFIYYCALDGSMEFIRLKIDDDENEQSLG